VGVKHQKKNEKYIERHREEIENETE